MRIGCSHSIFSSSGKQVQNEGGNDASPTPCASRSMKVDDDFASSPARSRRYIQNKKIRGFRKQLGAGKGRLASSDSLPLSTCCLHIFLEEKDVAAVIKTVLCFTANRFVYATRRITASYHDFKHNHFYHYIIYIYIYIYTYTYTFTYI